MIRYSLSIVALLLTATVEAKEPDYCQASGKCDDHYLAHAFKPEEELSPEQAALLRGANIDYETWTRTQDGPAATFLAITHVLSVMEIDLGDGESALAIQMLRQLTRLEGDRIRVILDRDLFGRWQQAGSRFHFLKPDGRREAGRIKFRDRTFIGSSLHGGYDIQGATGIVKMPRLQINYRHSDAEADIDLDGFAPFLWGFIPNLKHLKYANSDPRQWFEKLVRRFGDPGFRVRPY